MPLTDNFRNEALAAVNATNNVVLYTPTGTEIATVSTLFTVPAFGQQGDNTWFADNITFDNIAAGTIVGYYKVFRGVSITDEFISQENISGTVAERTIGPAGGRVILDIEVVMN